METSDYRKLVKVRCELKESRNYAETVAKRLQKRISPNIPLVVCTTLRDVLIQIDNMISRIKN